MGNIILREENQPTGELQWFEEVPRTSWRLAMFGYAILIVGVFGFVVWASTAPIEGAVVAPGTFVTTGQNKVVQHLEGGIIKEILVREGQVVRKGQPLLKLDNTQALADLKRLTLRKIQLEVTAARLQAEAEQKKSFDYPLTVPAMLVGEGVENVVVTEQNIFQARRHRLESEMEVLQSSIQSYGQRIEGYKFALQSSIDQSELLQEELKGKFKLFSKGLVRKTEYFALLRAEARFRGDIGQLKAQIQDYKRRVAGTNKEIRKTIDASIQAAVEKRQEVVGELRDIEERIKAQESILSRVVIPAPVAGVVIKLNYHTPGGVIRPGNDIMALLPIGDELVIEARIRPQDIDNVKNGLNALIRLSALNQRVTPMIAGRVIYVSADAIPDERNFNNDNKYVARVKLDSMKVASLQDFVPTPGMPTEVYIRTGDRTFFEYLMRPVMDTVSRAFRES